MNDVNETLNRIEDLLTQAEQALKNDDGSRWPPPPVPPKDRRDWATDNSSAVDPHGYESCKEYALTKLPMRPLLPVRRLALRSNYFFGNPPAEMADELVDHPSKRWGEWDTLETVQEAKDMADFMADVANVCLQIHGMDIEIKRVARSVAMRWSGALVQQFDRRDMTHAQRVAEAQLLQCRPMILSVSKQVRNNTRKLRLSLRKARELGLEPLLRLDACIIRFNRLSKHMYRSRKRQFPLPGYGLHIRR